MLTFFSSKKNLLTTTLLPPFSTARYGSWHIVDENRESEGEEEIDEDLAASASLFCSSSWAFLTLSASALSCSCLSASSRAYRFSSSSCFLHHSLSMLASASRSLVVWVKSSICFWRFKFVSLAFLVSVQEAVSSKLTFAFIFWHSSRVFCTFSRSL